MGKFVWLWFLAGVMVEVFNTWTRRWAAERLAPERRSRSVGWFAVGFVLRVVLTAGMLALAFRQSFMSGVLAWLGYYLCRMTLVWRLSRRLDRRSEQRSGGGGFLCLG